MQSVPRLYETFQPSHYNLKLTLEREKRIFSGTVLIDGIASADNDHLSLHANGLKVKAASINDKPVIFSLDAAADTIVLDAQDHSGEVRVSVEFSGTITDPMHGLYPCYYEQDGVKKELLATQLESHHAREVFPCVDEPEAKATYDLTLTTEKNVVALANMPVKDQIESDDKLVTTFETSPKMSSYLLAFVVGELHSKSVTTSGGVEVSVWATHAQDAKSFDFALDVGKRSIEFFDEYFGVPYPLPKADHVALPDFSSAAMENWGLITYRESCLLADESSAISTKQWIAAVITHEISHQWFGNLVTMKWWDDLWLNESFASLMEYVGPDALFPEWNIWSTFMTQRGLGALRRDYLPGVQAIKTEVNHPDEISTLFDPSIVYAKGARMLVMLHAYIGDEAFSKGLKAYFTKHAYQNTVGDDLWSALSEAAGTDINAFIRPWLEQPGMPVIRVEKKGDLLSLSQKRFVIPATNDDKLWPIPLHTQPASLPQLLDTRTIEVEVADDELVLINHDATSHVVVNYDEALLAKLATRLSGENPLNEVDRLSILNDLSLLARSGDQSATLLLELTKHYAHETSEPVWDIIALVIADLRRLVEGDDEAEAALKQFVQKLALPTYQRLGWNEKAGEHESDTKLRAITIGLLGYCEYKEVIDQSLKMFHDAKSPLDLSGELRSTILALTVKHGASEDIERLITEHRTTPSADLQDDIAAALTATKDKELISRLIGFFTNKDIVRPQDLFRWFAYLIRSRYGRELTWEWMTTHWDWIEKTFAGDKSYDDFVRYSAGGLGTHEWLTRYKEFFEPKRHITALTRAIDLGIADIVVRADWHERDSKALCDALKAGATSSSTR